MNEYVEKLKKVVRGKIGIFIDVANLEQSVKSMSVNPKDVPDDLKHLPADRLCWSVDYKKFKEFFESVGEINQIRFYTPAFDTASHAKFLSFLKKQLAYKLVTKPIKEYRDHRPDKPHRKANFDVELSIDAVELLALYDTFVLFSGDCDFEYLLKFLRGKKQKITIVFSRSGHIAKELPPACHHYFDVADFRNIFLKITQRAPRKNA